MIQTKPVIPPISSQKDRQFLKSVYAFIDNELKSVETNHPEQRYTIFKAAFDQVVEYVQAYQPILTEIKAEYEECIDVVKNGKEQACFLMKKIKEKTCQPMTVNNLKKRLSDLHVKVEKIHGENFKLKTELENIRKLSLDRKKKPDIKQIVLEKRMVPGLNTDEQADTKALKAKLIKVENELSTLKENLATKYVSKQKLLEMRLRYNTKGVLFEENREKRQIAFIKHSKLETAVECAHDYLSGQVADKTIGQAICLAIGNCTYKFSEDSDDDPCDHKAQRLLDYIERFEELLNSKQFSQAARHAAVSPQGVLRIEQTIQRLISAGAKQDDLLTFCKLLATTAQSYDKLDEKLTSFCVNTALRQNKIDDLSHWITQSAFDFSIADAENIQANCECEKKCNCKIMSLAYRIYDRLQSHIFAAICLTHFSTPLLVINYCSMKNFSMEDYENFIKLCGFSQIGSDLLFHLIHNNCLPLGRLLILLIDQHRISLASDILNRINTNFMDIVRNDVNTNEDEWFYICSEIGPKSECAVELLASIIVRNAIKQVADSFCPYQSRSASSEKLSETGYFADAELSSTQSRSCSLQSELSN